MGKFLRMLLLLLCVLLGSLPAGAATRQPVSQEYVDRYFTTVAAASCLGVYLPEESTEFSYLRSYGWHIDPQKLSDGRVETNFAVAHNYFSELKKRVFLVTFRGSANEKDWGINLDTDKVNYGGHTLEEMEALAAEPLNDDAPAVHMGFNTYVDTLLRSSVMDEAGGLRGVFRTVYEQQDTMLVLTGHSLGGAVATLLGERLVSLGMPAERLLIVTFGAPAVGNQHFAEQYGKAVRLLRITNTTDPVPGGMQTFIGGYKQFGEHIKYSMSPKISRIQHDMALYFDYSVSEFYEEYDRQVLLDRIYPMPDSRVTEGKPVVALWIKQADRLQRVASVVDLKRFITDEYKRMLPSYVVMDKQLVRDAYTRQDIVKQSRNSGADYILVCGIDGTRQRDTKYWYLTLEQSLFDGDGRMITMESMGRKVAPALGNIQAAGECLVEARRELHEHLPFVLLEYEPHLVK